ncbi:hypothetical protein [Hymenobacter lapidiphilus]|uniref:Carboxypeptidase regulatory-like domain-containing protein n=1 Tax=Hymenobacter lapidiphilus TaxID=2608003 RepID=A0A7Y7PSG4_9BACT|nr:hypothetical protein [Hymenobacter lapidiphilus]NVO33206.1 hypothetical protein [Hymenobacter lapidiphilus]
MKKLLLLAVLSAALISSPLTGLGQAAIKGTVVYEGAADTGAKVFALPRAKADSLGLSLQSYANYKTAYSAFHVGGLLSKAERRLTPADRQTKQLLKDAERALSQPKMLIELGVVRCPRTVADGAGNYVLPLPSGEYVLITTSAHLKAASVIEIGGLMDFQLINVADAPTQVVVSF